MKVPKPSPAMAVALLALVVASTGTAVAAKPGLIPGSQIKPHSITSKQLKPGAVDSKALGKDAVTAPNLAPGSVGSSELAAGSVGASSLSTEPLPSAIVPQVCPDGSKVVGVSCPAGTYSDVSGGATFNAARIPAAGGNITYFHANPTPSNATTDPQWAVSPRVPMRLSRLTAQIVGVVPTANWPQLVMVGVLVEGQATQAFCAIQSPTPGGTNSCAMPATGSILIPPGSRYTFAITVVAPSPPAAPVWDTFAVGFGYVTAQDCSNKALCV